MQAPPPPDPYKTAAAQGQENVQSTIASALVNNYNETNPYGSVAYNRIGEDFVTDALGNKVAVPRFERIVTLSPEQQALYEQQTQAGGKLNQLAISQIDRLQGTLNEPIDLSSLPEASGISEAYRKEVEDALMGRLNEQFAKDDARLTTKLANQGLTAGSEAYAADYDVFNRAKTDARIGALLAAGDEARAMAAAEQARRAQALQELLSVRSQPVNEISALLGGGQVTLPQFQDPYRQGIEAPPIGDYINDVYQAQLGSYNNMMSGLFGLGGTLLSALFSDERLKTAKRRVGYTDEGVPIYTYRYKAGGPTMMGVMAQDLEEVEPEAVATLPGGVKAVDYGRIR